MFHLGHISCMESGHMQAHFVNVLLFKWRIEKARQITLKGKRGKLFCIQIRTEEYHGMTRTALFVKPKLKPDLQVWKNQGVGVSI